MVSIKHLLCNMYMSSYIGIQYANSHIRELVAVGGDVELSSSPFRYGNLIPNHII